MIVCSCNVLSDGEVRACLGAGPGCPRTAAQVYQCLGCSPKCGRCARTIRTILDQALGEVHAGCADKCGSACPMSAKGEHGQGEHGQGKHGQGEHEHRHAGLSTPAMAAA